MYSLRRGSGEVDTGITERRNSSVETGTAGRKTIVKEAQVLQY
jgi:hypothetical protein